MKQQEKDFTLSVVNFLRLENIINKYTKTDISETDREAFSEICEKIWREVEEKNFGQETNSQADITILFRKQELELIHKAIDWAIKEELYNSNILTTMRESLS